MNYNNLNPCGNNVRAGCPGDAGIGHWVSPINCFGDSSMHTTGLIGKQD
jgi:hypothetical protein